MLTARIVPAQPSDENVVRAPSVATEVGNFHPSGAGDVAEAVGWIDEPTYPEVGGGVLPKENGLVGADYRPKNVGPAVTGTPFLDPQIAMPQQPGDHTVLAAPPQRFDDDVLLHGLTAAATVHSNAGATTARGRLTFKSFVDGVDASWRLCGWAYDPLAREPLEIHLLEEGVTVSTAWASEFRSDLAEAGLGDGKCGFYLSLPADMFDGSFHNLSVYVISAGRSDLIGGPFGIVLPRRISKKLSLLKAASAARIFEQVTGISAHRSSPLTPEFLEEVAQVFKQLGDRFGHEASLGLLYAHVLRRPIDHDGLVTRLARLHGDLSEYRKIVEEVLLSAEATNIHSSSQYLPLQSLDMLRAWLKDHFSLLELP
jgi:hypothetical protein